MSEAKLFRHFCLKCREVVKCEKPAPLSPCCGVILQLCPKVRKPFRQVAVNDPKTPWGVNPRLILEIYPNGVIYIRESKRQKRYEINASTIYVLAIRSSVAKVQAEKRAAKKLRRASSQIR